MTVWKVTQSYFDGDHDHGYFDLGLYDSIEAAKLVAEQFAQLRGYDKIEWLGAKSGDILKATTTSDSWGDEDEYVCVEECEVNAEPIELDKAEISKRLHITYT